MSYPVQEVYSYAYDRSGTLIKHKFSKLPRPFKMKHPVTKQTKIYDNKYMMFSDTHSHPLFIEKVEIKDEDACKRLGIDQISSEICMHPNMRSDTYPMNIITNKSTKKVIAIFWVKPFCNPINSAALYRNLDENFLFICMQLEKYTFSDAFNTMIKDYVDFDCTDAIARCTYCGEKLLGEIPEYLYTLNVCPECFSNNRDKLTEKLQTLSNQYKDNFVCKIKHNSKFDFLPPARLEEYKKNNEISEYYPIFTAEQALQSIGDVPKIEMDVCVMGLGSAGSGFIDQIGRTRLIDRYTLIDFDRVEEKNLRNQLYHSSVLGRYKAEAMESILRSFKGGNNHLIIKKYTQKFQEVGIFNFTNFKYVMLGFDTIKTRQEALDHIKEGKITAKYILDTRYDALNASIYLINTENKDEMKYYEDCLKEDGAIIETKEGKEVEKQWEEVTKDNPTWKELIKKYNPAEGGCTSFTRDVLHRTCGNFCSDCSRAYYHDYRGRCSLAFQPKCEVEMLKHVNEKQIVLPDILGLEATCTAWNIIDIYKYASTYLLSAVRELEEGREKPFTHIECTTQGLPQAMMLRK